MGERGAMYMNSLSKIIKKSLKNRLAELQYVSGKIVSATFIAGNCAGHSH